MLRKTNLLAMALFSIVFLLIVDAAEETTNESFDISNETLSLDRLNSAVSDEAKVNTVMPEQNHIIEYPSSYNDKKEGKAATASFGVYLQIVG